MKKQTSKLGSVAMAVGVVASALAGAVAWDIFDAPEVQVQTVYKTVTETEYVDVEVPVEVIVEKEVIVNNTVVVTDTELLQATCDRLLFDDLAECQEEVTAEQEALELALDFVNDNDFFDELENEGIVEDEDEVEIIKVYSDFEDIEVITSDFDDNKYKFAYEVKIEDTDADEKMKVRVVVQVEDGEVEFKSVALV